MPLGGRGMGGPMGRYLTEEEMTEALKKANIYDFVRDQEKGLDTMVGKGGVYTELYETQFSKAFEGD